MSDIVDLARDGDLSGVMDRLDQGVDVNTLKSN